MACKYTDHFRRMRDFVNVIHSMKHPDLVPIRIGSEVMSEGYEEPG